MHESYRTRKCIRNSQSFVKCGAAAICDMHVSSGLEKQASCQDKQVQMDEWVHGFPMVMKRVGYLPQVAAAY